MLAEVGANAEGPLPWVERDYTPISTWAEWEKGKCDILIKVYPDGAATSWLHKQVLATVSVLSSLTLTSLAAASRTKGCTNFRCETGHRD